MGWGAKGFFLVTTTWPDLKIFQRLKDIFGVGDIGMNILFLN